MNDNVLLVMGASSEVGIKLIEKVKDNYSLIYAHYGSSRSEIEKLGDIGGKLRLIQADLRDKSAIDTIINQIQQEDVVPNHVVLLPAPKVKNERFTKTNWESFEDNINISLRSAVLVLQWVLKRLTKEKRSGRVVFMLSSYTVNIPPRFMSSYVCVKYAMLGLMKALATEYDSKNITVNGVSPGMMETKFLMNIFDSVIEDNAQKSPFGRNLFVDEVIPTIQYLLSDGAQRLTGQNIVVTGGM